MYHVPTVARPSRHIFRWWLASLFGGSVSGILMFLIAWRAPTTPWIVDLGWISGATCAAIGQALVLPSGLITRGRWILIALLGSSLWVGLAMANAMLSHSDRMLENAFREGGNSAIIAMLVLGLCQAGYLRRSFAGTNWWVGAAIVGGVLESVIGLSGWLYRWANTTSTIEDMLFWVAIFGLRWMLLTAMMGVVFVYNMEPRTPSTHGVVSADALNADAVQQERPPAEPKANR
jgi:hypothetical protein